MVQSINQIGDITHWIVYYLLALNAPNKLNEYKYKKGEINHKICKQMSNSHVYFLQMTMKFTF